MTTLYHAELSEEELAKRKYTFPKERKFPLPDKKHVLSAIKFFNYVSPDKEKILAEAILKKIKEYGMTDINVGPDNRFIKYYKRRDGDNMSNTYLTHSAKGKKWSQHKYIDIKNGTYIYPKFMYDKKRKESSKQEKAILADKKKMNDQKYNDYMQIELQKRSGQLSDRQYEKARSATRRKYEEFDKSSKKATSANAYNKIKELYKYQNSFNYKASKAISNFMAKGKSFLDKLFKKNKKPKRTTEEALALNTKLRAKDRTIKRKGLAKYGKM